MSKFIILMIILINTFSQEIFAIESNDFRVEKKALKYILSPKFSGSQADRRCHQKEKYQVYLIDNFDHCFNIVPEVKTSHGEMVLKLIKSGRNDIHVKTLNTSLLKGLAQVFNEIIEGACVDAVISSIPGSNYTYDQINSLFSDKKPINAKNILLHQDALMTLMKNIAFNGFPSVEWLERIDANSTKLRNDAKKVAIIEALGRLNIPVILPYGNLDATHKGKTKSINLLSLPANAKVYSALNQKGERLPGYPYSPLSSGDERAVYDILECPHADDPIRANLDINDDGYWDYRFVRNGKIPCDDIARCRRRGTIGGTSLIPPNKLRELLPPKNEKRP